MHTKTITVNTDWLSEIEGLSVANVIAYLQGLPQEHIIHCYMDGDTHGVELVSELHHIVPMTDEEIFATKETNILKRLAEWEKNKAYYIKKNQHDRVPMCDAQINVYYVKLAELKAEYNK